MYPALISVFLILSSVLAIHWCLRRNRQRKRITAEEELTVERHRGTQPQPGERSPERFSLPDLERPAELQQQAGDDVRHGIKAFMAGNYDKAARILPFYAEAGHVKAQTILAKMYFSGHGVEQDPDKYRYWLQRAADKGHKPSKAKLKKLSRASDT